MSAECPYCGKPNTAEHWQRIAHGWERIAEGLAVALLLLVVAALGVAAWGIVDAVR